MKPSVLSSISIIALLFSSLSFASSVGVDIKLSPAGSFTGKTEDVKGLIKKVGNKYVGDNIIVNLKALKTGLGLRDEHTQKHLETAKYPDAVLVHAEGESGKGRGTIRIRGIEKPIEGTYKISGKELFAEFPIKLSDFKIENVRYMSVGVKDTALVHVTMPVQ